MPSTDDNYFSYIHGYELALMDNESQAAVYRAIKSFSPNGQGEVPLSIRDIQERTLLSYGTIQAEVKKLIGKSLVTVTGVKGHRGGKVSVYKLVVPRPVHVGKRSATDHLARGSDHQLIESDQLAGTKPPQDKREEMKRTNHFLSSAKLNNATSAGPHLPPARIKRIFDQIGGLR